MQLTKISEHARERYAERVKDKEGLEIKQYVAVNRERIDQEITKLAEHAKAVYSGPSSEDNKTIIMLVQGSWVLLCSEESSLITLFKKDLELDDERENNIIMGKYVEKIRKLVGIRDEAARITQDERARLTDEIQMLGSKIEGWKASIRDAEARKKALEDDRATAGLNLSLAERAIREFINGLLTKRVFGIK